MRILISDYSGHPFQVQLSRELARRGYTVRHTFSAAFQTPKGNLLRTDSDADGFSIAPVSNKRPFQKNSFVARRAQEIEIGHALADQIRQFSPDVVLSSNAPLDTQRIFQQAAREAGASFVFWLQDIYSEAISRVVPRKLPMVGHAIAAWYRTLEFRMLRASDHVVAITADFVPILERQGVARDRISVIENWAPLDELPQHGRDNAWARANMAPSGLRIVYSGTLGYKHNPGLLARIAAELPDAHVHVFSEGDVADGLAQQARGQGLSNLSVHPWVPFAHLPEMLGGADVFVAMIEPEAGVYSVPSKILTYLAIGRPILASVPLENLAAKLIGDHDAGFVADPSDPAALLSAAGILAANPHLRERQGANGRRYAADAFDVTRIADRFLTVMRPRAGT